MKKASNIALVSAIIIFLANTTLYIIDIVKAIELDYLTYYVNDYLLGFIACICLISLVYFMYSFNKRLKNE